MGIMDKMKQAKDMYGNMKKMQQEVIKLMQEELIKLGLFDMHDVKNQDPKNPLELVVVNPGPVFGPTLSGDLSGASMGMYKDLILGKMPMLPQSSINMSDVRDIAKIHVLAMENEKAKGQRFIVSLSISENIGFKPLVTSELVVATKLNGVVITSPLIPKVLYAISKATVPLETRTIFLTRR